MKIILDESMLRHYVQAAVDVSPERSILIDEFLENAIEAEAAAIGIEARRLRQDAVKSLEQYHGEIG